MTFRAFGAGVGVGLLIGAAFMWQRDAVHGVELKALKDSTAAQLADRAAKAESVTVYVPVVEQAKAESRAAGDLVTVVNETTLSVKTTPTAAPQLVGVPEAVTAKMRADSIYIVKLEAQNRLQALVIAADANVIRTQAATIRLLEKKGRCGRRCGIVIGVTATAAAAVVVEQVRKLVQ